VESSNAQKYGDTRFHRLTDCSLFFYWKTKYVLNNNKKKKKSNKPPIHVTRDGCVIYGLKCFTKKKGFKTFKNMQQSLK
jgi:hypothetical protein